MAESCALDRSPTPVGRRVRTQELAQPLHARVYARLLVARRKHDLTQRSASGRERCCEAARHGIRARRVAAGCTDRDDRRKYARCPTEGHEGESSAERMADERSIAIGSKLSIDVRNKLLHEESREELLVPTQIRPTIDLIDTDDDLRWCGVVMQITDDVVAGSSDGDVVELPRVAVHEVRRLVALSSHVVVRRQAHVYDALLAENLRLYANQPR